MNSLPLMNPALRAFWEARGYHIKSLIGGRASSKTWDAAAAALLIAASTRGRFLCTREFQANIEDSVYTVLVQTIDRLGLQAAFEIQKTRIICRTTGTDFVFYGRQKNFAQIKGTEGVTVHWGEECELLTQEQYDIIDGTISRNEGAQHWLIFNPRFVSDFVYGLVTSGDPDTLLRRINYDENPFLSQTMREVIEKRKRTDLDGYRHLYLGQPLEDDDAVMIKPSWIDAAIDAHIKLNMPAVGTKTLGYDVADDGGDRNATVFAHGHVILHADEWKGKEDEILQSAMRANDTGLSLGADMLVYDCMGVGAFVGSKLNELDRHCEHTGWAAGGAVIDGDEEYLPGRLNKDHFANVKAQAWQLVADRFRNTYAAVVNGEHMEPDQIISLSSDLPYLEKLKRELASPRRTFDRNGRVLVERKEDMAKRGVKSPNIADAVILAFAPRPIEYWSIFD